MEQITDNFLTKTWADLSIELAKLMSPTIPDNIFQDPLIQRIMSAEKAPYIKDEKIFLENQLVQDINGLSDTSIHHLYHLEKYQLHTQNKLSEIQTIIEWGAGWGDLCWLFKKRYNHNATYIIIDIPIVVKLQSHFFSQQGYSPNVVDDQNNHTIIPGEINIVPIYCLPQIKYYQPIDLFISTWAITESGYGSIDYIIQKNMFDAKHILLGYENTRTDQFPYAKTLIDHISQSGQILNIDIISPYQFYFFR